MIGIRKELRSVQHALREDIERLDSWLKFLNIAGMPVLITIMLFGGLAYGGFQQRRKG